MAQVKAIYERYYCGCDSCLGNDIDDDCYDPDGDHCYCCCYHPVHEDPNDPWNEDFACVNIERQRVTILKTAKNYEYHPAIWASPGGFADDIPAKLIIGRKEYENLIYLEVDGEVLLDDRRDKVPA